MTYRHSDKDFDFLTWQEVISERNIIINSSANSKQEHACTASYMGVIVTAISQSRGKGVFSNISYKKILLTRLHPS